MNNELTHYGVKGMHWGVRKQPQYNKKEYKRKSELSKTYLGKNLKGYKSKKTEIKSDKDVSFKKGYTVTHITPKNITKLKDGQDLFVSADKYDKNLYRTFLSAMMMKKGYGIDTPIKEVSFKLNQELKAPSPNKQKQLFNEFYSKNEQLVLTDLKEYYKHHAKKSDTYSDFVEMFDSNSDSKAQFYNYVKNNGYNALLDVHDMKDGSWINAKCPLVVMDAVNSLGSMNIKDISVDDMKRSFNNIYSKKGGLNEH